MFRSIVVGTDGSDTATQAVRQAIELARSRDRARGTASDREAPPEREPASSEAEPAPAGDGIDTTEDPAEPAEVARLGWKERWQVSGDEFDPNFVRRLGAQPPRITDPRALAAMSNRSLPFGDGSAAPRIATAVNSWLEARRLRA